MERHLAAPGPHVEAFVEQMLSAGGTLMRLIDALVDALVANGATCEGAVEDVLEMLTGTVAVRLASVPAADFVRAAELIDQAVEAVLADLKRAEELARRRERRNGALSPMTEARRPARRRATRRARRS